MKRLLLPLLAALALPTAVNAETWYLLGSSKERAWTVPMPNKEQCESEGKRFINPKENLDDWKGHGVSYLTYICIKGK